MAVAGSELTAEAEVREMFPLKTHGRWVLVLENGFRGRVFPDGIVESELGSAPYVGPEFVYLTREPRAWLAIGVREEAKALFKIGQTIKLYRKASQ